ncbi:MAG TPA: hypothetical protein VMQ86_07200 [Bryobacteraceae bacterium]|jgi:uncharacterized protein RhaS with RHS repeats|nr:hypothetical protein [Bryobacteraceae bacterium]
MPTNDLAKSSVHGPVHSVRTEHVNWDLTLERWTVPEYFGIVRFHPDGRIRETESHNRDGSIWRSSYIYDAAGRIQQEVQFGVNGVPSEKTVYSYDEAGRLLRIASEDRDGTQRESAAYNYGQDGKTTKVVFLPKLEPNVGYGIDSTEQSYDATGAPIIATRYERPGQPDETLFYDSDHRLLRRVIFTRDSTGRLMSEEVHLEGPIPSLDAVKELENAPEGTRKAMAAAFAKLFGPQRVMSSTTYSYDGKDRLLERRMRMGELGDHRTTYRYDERDRLVEESTENSSRQMRMDGAGNLLPTKETSNVQHLRFEYEYDPQGNWTDRVGCRRPEPNPNFERSHAVRREIGYYAS